MKKLLQKKLLVMMNAFFQFVCPSNPELLLKLVPDTDDVKQLAKICLVSRSFRDFMFSTLTGRSAWLQTASKVTGYDGSKIIDIRVTDFQYQLKLLVCPWLSEATPLLFEYPEDTFSYSLRINLIGKSRLLFRLTEPGGEQAENTVMMMDDDPPRVFAFDAIPGKSESDFEKTLRQLPNSSIMTFYRTIDKKEPKGPMMIADPIPMFADDTRRQYRQINKTTFAVLESINNEHCMGYSEGGVYFMSNRDPENPKMLRHTKYNFMNCFLDVDMCAGPQRIWFANSDCISYFGPQTVSKAAAARGERKHVLECDKENSLIGRMTPALWMAYQGDAKGAIDFMENELHGLDINTRSQVCGRTVLHYAVYGERVEAIEELIDAKADVNQRDDRMNTPLMMAACCMDAPCIRMLCKHGADINLAGNSGNTPLLCMKHGHDDYTYTENIIMVLDELINAGVDLNQTDINGETILFSNTIAKDTEVIRYMISKGSDPHHRNHDGNTALHTCFNGDNNDDIDLTEYELPKTLVKEFGVDINSKNKMGLTPLSMNILGLTTSEIRLLVEELGADTSVKTSKGLTILQAFDQRHLMFGRGGGGSRIATTTAKEEEDGRECRDEIRKLLFFQQQ